MESDLVLLKEKAQQIPGSVNYSIKRYSRHPLTPSDEIAMISYHLSEDRKSDKLDLRFCIPGNTWCNEKNKDCNFCRVAQSTNCGEKVETIDVVSFSYTPSHLLQFVKGKKQSSFSEQVLNFTYADSFSKLLPLCGRTKVVLDDLLNHSFSDSFENIYINAQAQILLLYSLDCMIGETVDQFSCKFLANEADRNKIIEARQILLKHISEPLTIKELSRKVAINECYLKQGFREMFGVTIFEFFQNQRMEHARYLLYEKGLSVTDVSALLGYSSISHFSTAFKKHTGLKPCELLFR